MGKKKKEKAAKQEAAREKRRYHATVGDILERHAARIIGFLVSGGVAAIVLLRAKPEDLPRIAEILFRSDFALWLGWGLAILFLILLVVAYTIVRKRYRSEIDRLCRERDGLQERLLGGSVKHSGRKPGE